MLPRRTPRLLVVIAALGPVIACSNAPSPSPPTGALTASAQASAAPVAAASSAGVAASASASVAPVASATASASGAGPVASASASALAAAPEGMALVPAGTFTMGQNKLGEQDEHPAHQVTLGAFYLDLTEVTNEAYQRAVAAGVCRPHDPENARANRLGDDRAFRGARQPISAIPWEDAKNYCAWVGKRLPTEAEWEHAARGDDGRTYPWGEEPPTPERAVYHTGHTGAVGTHPAGAGPYGHLDLAGNVWEWVADYYDPHAYRREGASRGVVGSCEEIMKTLSMLREEHQFGFTGSNPIPTECERVLRGGAFNYHAKGLRSSNRVHHPGRFRLVMSGFRCALTPGSSPIAPASPATSVSAAPAASAAP